VKRYFQIIAVVIFLAGAVLLSIAYAKHPAPRKLQPFVATYITTLETQDAQNGQSALAVRAVTGDGRWRETRWREAGKVVEMADANGVYSLDDGQGLQYTGPNSQDEISPDRFAQATRTEMVAGLKAYIFRTDNPDGYIEYYYVPEMGSHHIKAVIYNASTHYKYVREAIAIQFRSVSDDEVAVPKLPVKFDDIEKHMEAMRQSGALNPDFEAAVQTAKARMQTQYPQ
jgi:hypothetical protein